ncbi:MAG: sulfurtransferase complex subunit TusB [Gallionellaceae bacterium]|nr:sulfurtransferase complex subunit TusB [Gallionellaceae bacterium]
MLHIINQSPLNSSTLDTCLNTATGGDILLIEDAVYAATKGNAAEAKLKAVAGKFKLYVLTPDLEARGLGDRMMDSVAGVDYAGFVDLVANNKNCQSWL